MRLYKRYYNNCILLKITGWKTGLQNNQNTVKNHLFVSSPKCSLSLYSIQLFTLMVWGLFLALLLVVVDKLFHTRARMPFCCLHWLEEDSHPYHDDWLYLQYEFCIILLHISILRFYRILCQYDKFVVSSLWNQILSFTYINNDEVNRVVQQKRNAS